LQLAADYKYDVFGNRTEKVVDNDGPGGASAVTTRFAHDGWNPAKPPPIGLENFDIWAEFDGDGTLTGREFQGDGVDQHFGFIRSGTVYWQLGDHLGSTRKVLNNSGTVVNAIVYGGFGGIASETDSTKRGLYAWTGRELDAETALQYNRARYYDAVTGRWISQDPLGFDAGDSNLYRYAKNDPIDCNDPSGLQVEFNDALVIPLQQTSPSQSGALGPFYDPFRDPLGTGGRVMRDPTYEPLLGVNHGLGNWRYDILQPGLNDTREARALFAAAKERFLNFADAVAQRQKANIALGMPLKMEPSPVRIPAGAMLRIDKRTGEGVIHIDVTNPRFNGSIDKLVGAMLWETLNATNAKAFVAIANNAAKGNLSRIDFVVDFEYLEYETLQLYSKLTAAAIKNKAITGWGDDTDLFPGANLLSFEASLISQIPSHTSLYADRWNKQYWKAWKSLPQNAKADPNVPSAATRSKFKNMAIITILTRSTGFDVSP